MNLARQLIEGELPVIEKGIPLPLPAKIAAHDRRRGEKSPWPEFILRLEPGDSFVISIRQSVNVMTIAKWMGIYLVKGDLPWNPSEQRMVRIWRAH